MAAKPETTFYTSVHRHLPSLDKLHREKMANPYRGGTADHWYSGPVKDLWVEWKFMALPKRDDTIIDLVTPRGKKGESPLSRLQQDWLKSRDAEGRHVWVVLGFKEGGVVFEFGAWAGLYTTRDVRARIQSRADIAARIARHTGYST